MAESLGLSAMTVSRALREMPGVAPEISPKGHSPCAQKGFKKFISFSTGRPAPPPDTARQTKSLVRSRGKISGARRKKSVSIDSFGNDFSPRKDDAGSSGETL